MRRLIAGSRGSRLAIAQTNAIINALDHKVDIKKISTRGDKITDVTLASVEGKGFFTREIDEALLAGNIDFAVHSLKDLPVDLPRGIVLAAIPKRETAKDVIVGPFKDLNSLPKNAIIGTSSIRRKAEILRLRSDVRVKELRGNIDTRIKKLNDGNYDAIIVSEAGMLRLGYTQFNPLSPEIFIPAVCQGALGITVRTDDNDLIEFMTKLEDLPTKIACKAERAFLSELNAGCQVPAGAYSIVNIEKKKYEIYGFVSSTDGSQFIKLHKTEYIDNAKNCAVELAKDLLSSGGNEILKSMRNRA